MMNSKELEKELNRDYILVSGLMEKFEHLTFQEATNLLTRFKKKWPLNYNIVDLESFKSFVEENKDRKISGFVVSWLLGLFKTKDHAADILRGLRDEQN